MMGMQMTQQLFRRECLAARRDNGMGGICLAQPLAQWVLTLGAVLVVLTIAVYLYCASYAQRSTVTGRLVPTLGLASVLAPASGVLAEMDATEGARVAAGQRLAVINVPRATLASGSASPDLEAALRERDAGLRSVQQGQQRALAAQARGLIAQIDAATAELAQVQAQIDTRERQARINSTTLARMRELREQQYVSQLQLQQQESAVLDQVGAVQELEQRASALKRDILQLRQSRDELAGQRQAVDAGTQRDLATLTQERVEMRAAGAVVIVAPVAGIVATQIAKPGQAVQEGQPLFTLLPGDGKLEAELLLPSRAAGFIAPGDHVLLRYPAYPYQKFGHQQGRVASVSRSALGANELGALLGTTGGAQPLYRVTVALARQSIPAYGKEEALKPGMLVDADIVGETRRLAEWLFEPLYSMRGKLGSS